MSFLFGFCIICMCLCVGEGQNFACASASCAENTVDVAVLPVQFQHVTNSNSWIELLSSIFEPLRAPFSHSHSLEIIFIYEKVVRLQQMTRAVTRTNERTQTKMCTNLFYDLGQGVWATQVQQKCSYSFAIARFGSSVSTSCVCTCVRFMAMARIFIFSIKSNSYRFVCMILCLTVILSWWGVAKIDRKRK